MNNLSFGEHLSLEWSWFQYEIRDPLTNQTSLSGNANHAASVERLLSEISQRYSDPIAFNSLIHVLIHNLERPDYSDVICRQNYYLVMLTYPAGLNVSNGDKAYSPDVEMLIDGKYQR